MMIVISGGGGFVGLSVAEAALVREEEVILISDRALPTPVQAALERLPGRLRVEIADVRDGEAMSSIMSRGKVDALFPFAALTPSAQTESERPEAVIDVNLFGFITQLRAARDHGVGRVIVPSSGGVYGESSYTLPWLDEETTPCRPNSIYGVTKFAVEATGLRLGDLWQMDTLAVRIGGVFGPWERQTGAREMFGPHYRMLRLAMAGEDITLPARWPATSSIYSRDLAAALLHVAQLPAPAHRVYNLCTGRDWSDDLPDWADMLCNLYPGVAWRRANADEPGNLVVTDPRDRGRLVTARLGAEDWSPSFLGRAAYTDYADWTREHAGCF